jgi:hypothetical protein
MNAARLTLAVTFLACASASASDPEPEGSAAASPTPAAPVAPVTRPAPAPRAPEPAPAPEERASRGEQLAFYAAGGVYGLTAGVWVNSLFDLTNPGIAPIFPIALGTAGVIGAYAIDTTMTPRRGVLAATTLGMGLGAANGAGIALAQANYANPGEGWNFATQGTFTFLLMTAGAAGGYAYGEYARPDSRAVALTGNGAAWGALTGALFGAGVTGGPWGAGSSLWGTIGMNGGAALAATVAASAGAPSFRTQKYMWSGYAIGAAVSSVVYIAYAFSDDNPRAGLVTNALGGVAGLAIGGVMGAGLEDEPEVAPSAWANTHFTVAPVNGGGMAMAVGSF